MEDHKKISVTVSVFYEIRDSEMYGGIGSIGYMRTSVDGNLKMLNNDFEAYVSNQKKSVASGMGVPAECVRVITQEEYEMNTDDED
ncbi:MAG: hypothetical protein HFI33_05985 [Lachnospiraceae bacterium]|nr:hypothetical protein [Lachnospiraceae bacterium]